MADTSYDLTDPASPPPIDYTQPMLPKSMSRLIAIAIADARSLDPSLYHPMSGQWHAKPLVGPCEICLAGSLIAGTFKSASDRQRFPWYFGLDVENKLFGLDSMRCGHWTSAFRFIYGFGPTAEIDQRLYALGRPDYMDFDGWDQFRAHLDSLEAILPALREIEAAAFSS
ncbi:MAG: hypothetical protein OXB98_00050 [Bryobacterales bacterium]|nr:hypothetical protein [Bryobacterales bacterium]